MSRSTVLLLVFVGAGVIAGIVMNPHAVDWGSLVPRSRGYTGVPPADISRLRRLPPLPARGGSNVPAATAPSARGTTVAPEGPADGKAATGVSGATDSPAAPAIPRAEPPIVITAEAASDPARSTLFVPGTAAAWTRLDLEVSQPLWLQAGGEVVVSGVAAGPAGVPGAPPAASGIDGGDLVLAAAPYLGLIGRVCSVEQCSAPFFIGARSLLCPSTIGVRGNLELWTNNRARLGAAQTRSNYSAATGGFHVYAEPALESSCGGPTIEAIVATDDASKLATGQVLDRPEFVVSSSQSNWKPFFLPLDRPIRITAYGQMKPASSAEPTGPEGIAVTGPQWTYPSAPQVVVDGDHVLFAASLPYQSLIGRVCGSAGCGATFAVGTGLTICAPAGYRDRLELWINHIIPPPTLMGEALPVSMQAFVLQTRSGAYRFSVTSVSACGE